MRRLFHHFLYCWLAIHWATSTVKGINEEPLLAEKRAPSGFLGMRGKKYDNYLDSSGLQQQNTQSFVDDNENELPADLEYIDKRAPSFGFQGVRGKKFYEPDYYHIKRVPMGFQGMRGKKNSDLSQLQFDRTLTPNMWDVEPNLLALENYINSNSNYEKRAPSMGFQGMRGKKDMEELVKRAPADAFFGMRGKKLPTVTQSGFFGMRGKKYPYEFRGKFVGVRGKKFFIQHDNSVISKANVDDNLIPTLNTQYHQYTADNELNNQHFYLGNESSQKISNDNNVNNDWEKQKIQDEFDEKKEN